MRAGANRRGLIGSLTTGHVIYASILAGLVMLLLIFEQLGVGSLWLSQLMFAVPVLLYAAIAMTSRTTQVEAFFVADREVPHVFNGFAMAAVGLGGVAFFALTGAVFLLGFDAMSLALGWLAGLVLLAVLFAPYIRKSGAYTFPGFLDLRFRSMPLRLLATAIVVTVCTLLLVAELHAAGLVLSLFTQLDFSGSVYLTAAIVLFCTLTGGMRSATWSQTTQSILAGLGYLVPLVVIAILLTGLPAPQLTFGRLLETLGTLEASNGIQPITEPDLSVYWPGDAPLAFTKPFLQSFGAFSATEFIGLALCFAMGVACVPALLARPGTAPSVFDARKAAAWAVLLAALFLISVPSFAVFTRYLAIDQLLGSSMDALPEWANNLIQGGLLAAADTNGDGVLGAGEALFARDGAVIDLSVIAGFPFVLSVLIGSAGLAAALAAATGHALMIGLSVSDDMTARLGTTKWTTARRLLAARISLAVACLLAAFFARSGEFDILRLAGWAFSLAASGLFPAALLAIWWRHATVWGVLAGMAAGFAIAATHILIGAISGEPAVFGLDSVLSALIGVPMGLAVTIAVSLVTRSRDRAALRRLGELRKPEGETLLARRARDDAMLAARK